MLLYRRTAVLGQHQSRDWCYEYL